MEVHRYRRGDVTVKRSRRLVVSSLSTIGNYVYGFFWYFYQDGTIGVEVKATGIPLVSALAPGNENRPAMARASRPGIDAHVHQHVFSFRFDMCVDGRAQFGHAKSISPPRRWAPTILTAMPLRTRETQLTREREAQRVMDMAAARYWRVINPNREECAR